MKFFIFFLSFAFATISCLPRDLTRNSLIPCFQLADMNHNNELSEMEIAMFFDSHNITETTVTNVMNKCDINHDGKLTMYDLEAPMSCLRLRSMRLIMCLECNKYM